MLGNEASPLVTCILGSLLLTFLLCFLKINPPPRRTQRKPRRYRRARKLEHVSDEPTTGQSHSPESSLPSPSMPSRQITQREGHPGVTTDRKSTRLNSS